MSKQEETVLGSGEDGQEKTGAVKKDSRWAIFGRVLRGGNKTNVNSTGNETKDSLFEDEKVDLSNKKSGRLTLPRQLKKLEENLFSRDSNSIGRSLQKNDEMSRPQTVGTGRFTRFFRFGKKETKADTPKEGTVGSSISCEDTSILSARAGTRELLADPEERDSSQVDCTRQVVAADNS